MTSSGSDVRADIAALIPALRAFARSMVPDRNDADDLVQETLLRGISNIHHFRPGTNLKSWLFTIMRNTFYTSLKLRKRERPGDADCVAGTRAVQPSQEWAVRGEEIREALETLSPEQREVVVLVGALGVTYEDAAEICNCAVGTIKSRLNRARARILEKLGSDDPRELLDDDDPIGRVATARYEATSMLRAPEGF
jgi:RNA polymerase sigma factor (sigma-70 family)